MKFSSCGRLGAEIASSWLRTERLERPHREVVGHDASARRTGSARSPGTRAAAGSRCSAAVGDEPVQVHATVQPIAEWIAFVGRPRSARRPAGPRRRREPTPGRRPASWRGGLGQRLGVELRRSPRSCTASPRRRSHSARVRSTGKGTGRIGFSSAPDDVELAVAPDLARRRTAARCAGSRRRSRRLPSGASRLCRRIALRTSAVASGARPPRPPGPRASRRCTPRRSRRWSPGRRRTGP